MPAKAAPKASQPNHKSSGEPPRRSSAGLGKKKTPPGSAQIRGDLSDLLGARGDSSVNPFTGAPYDRQRRAEIAGDTRWPTLRMYTDGAVDLYKSLQANHVTVLSAGTGSGKTVIAPKIAHVWARRNARSLGAGTTIAVTNPKKMTTLKNAEFSAMLAQVSLGAEIGYHYRGAHRSSASRETQIEYVTDGWLLQRAREDPGMSRYAVVLVDEVHERPVPTDFLLLAARNAMVARSRSPLSSKPQTAAKGPSGHGGPESPAAGPLKLVVMSATLDPVVFANYFRSAGLSVGVVEVGANPNHPISRIHRPIPAGAEAEYLERAVGHVLDIHVDPLSDRGAILVFVPVKKDARKGCKLLAQACIKSGLGEDCLVAVDWSSRVDEEESRETDDEKSAGRTLGIGCVPLFSNAGADTENRAQRKPPIGTRNVIFATNVAESSLTIESLDYVVDTGRAFVVRHDPSIGAFVSGKEWVTRAQALQRLGRVGRERRGTALLMYPERFLKGAAIPDGSPPDADGMRERPEPTVTVEDITDHLFQMAASDPAGSWDRVEEEVSKLLTPPSALQIRYSRRCLLLLGCIGPPEPGVAGVGGKGGLFVGVVGRNVANVARTFRVRYDVATMMLVGTYYGASADAALLAGIAEETKGELNALWRTFFNADGGTVQRPPKGFLTVASEEGSQHAALARQYAELTEGRKSAQENAARDVDWRVWEGVGRFVRRVGPKLESFVKPSEVEVLSKRWPFDILLPATVISKARIGMHAAVFVANLPRALVVSRGGSGGRPVLDVAAEGSGEATTGATNLSRKKERDSKPETLSAPIVFSLPEDLSSNSTAGDVAVCGRLSVSHGGAGAKTFPPQAEAVTIFKAASSASENFANVVSRRAGL